MNSDLMWLAQPRVTDRQSLNGSGTYQEDYQADKDRGLEAAAANGFIKGVARVIAGEIYVLTDIVVSDYGEGAFDLVTVTFVSQHGPAGSGGGRGQRLHKAGDEEWRFRGTSSQMRAGDAYTQGWITGFPDGVGENDTITITKPTLERKTWLAGAKKTAALPATFEKAVEKYDVYITAVGNPIEPGSKWIIRDVSTDADGSLLLVTTLYEYQPGSIVTQNNGGETP